MITDAPLSAASHFDDLARRVRAFIAAAQSASAGGITWVEFGELMVALLRLAIHAADTLTGLSGAEKKALVLEAVAALFDTVADKAIPAYLYPLWLLARGSVRALVLALASGAIEILLPMVRSAK
jgi:hypothetical protein